MDIGSIIVLILVAGALGTGVYFQLTGKKNIAKAIYAGIIILLVAVGIMNKEKLSKIKEKSQTAIDDSKENDSKRNDVVEKIDDRITKNKDLLDEINKALNDN